MACQVVMQWPDHLSARVSDSLPGGPNVYLYGFLATLVLIFLVSIGVAWKSVLFTLPRRYRFADVHSYFHRILSYSLDPTVRVGSQISSALWTTSFYLAEGTVRDDYCEHASKKL